MILMGLLLQAATAEAPPPVDTTVLVERANQRLSAVEHCAAAATTDITVCGRRAADRYRVPFVVTDPGDPAHESVMAERTRLLHRTTPLDDLSIFLVGGGMVGVTASTAHGVGTLERRPLAP